MNKIKITKPMSPLEREEWTYWFDDRIPALVLDSYVYEKRASTRHRNWTQLVYWSRISNHYTRASRHPPRLDPQIDAEALEQFRASIRVEPTVLPKKADGYRQDRR